MSKWENDWKPKWLMDLITAQSNDQLTEWLNEKLTVGKMTSWWNEMAPRTTRTLLKSKIFSTCFFFACSSQIKLGKMYYFPGAILTAPRHSTQRHFPFRHAVKRRSQKHYAASQLRPSCGSQSSPLCGASLCQVSLYQVSLWLVSWRHIDRIHWRQKKGKIGGKKSTIPATKLYYDKSGFNPTKLRRQFWAIS